MWLGFFKECKVSLIFLGINLLSLSITFFWSQLNLWSTSQHYLAVSFLSQSRFLMMKYSSYTHHLRFFVRCHHNKILPKDLQLKCRIKTEQSKSLLQCAGKLLEEERIHINHVIRDRFYNSIELLKGKSFESITPEEFHLVQRINTNSYKKYFELTKKRHIRKFNELISKNKVTQSATNITDKKK